LYDLHSHILPGFDDGSPDLETSLEMARIAVADGIEVMACTPHIMPGVYDNEAAAIRVRIEGLSEVLRHEGIPLRLVAGADVHISPTLVRDINAGTVPGLNEPRYFLIEPPHHVLPPRFDDLLFNLMTAGHYPILTHPERLSWIDGHYDLVERLARAGVLMQITAGSLTGRFGRRPRYWGERMLDEGMVHILATDAHDGRKRPPLLAEGRDAAAAFVGDAEAELLVVTNPLHILQNVLPSDMGPAASAAMGGSRERTGFLSWLRQFGGSRTRGIEH
jgi:protein-tyrosine phosphatase